MITPQLLHLFLKAIEINLRVHIIGTKISKNHYLMVREEDCIGSWDRFTGNGPKIYFSSYSIEIKFLTFTGSI